MSSLFLSPFDTTFILGPLSFMSLGSFATLLSALTFIPNCSPVLAGALASVFAVIWSAVPFEALSRLLQSSIACMFRSINSVLPRSPEAGSPPRHFRGFVSDCSSFSHFQDDADTVSYSECKSAAVVSGANIAARWTVAIILGSLIVL